MSKYDGSIRIGTKIDTKKLEENLVTLENKVLKSAQKVQTLQKRLDELCKSKIETKEFKEVSEQLSKAETKLVELQGRMAKFLETGGRKNSSTFKKMQYDAAELKNTIKYANGELQDLVDTNKAFVEPTGTDEYKKLAMDLQIANSELDLNKEKLSEIQFAMEKNGSAATKMKNSMVKAGKDGSKAFDRLKKSIKKVILLVIGVETIRTAFMKVRTAIVEMLPSLRNADKELNESMNSWESASTSLKGALTSAFGQIASVVLPILTKIVVWVTNCANAFAQLMAYLRGQSTWNKIKVGANGASKAINGVGKSAKNAAGALAAFDELNVLNKSEDSNGSSSGSDVQFEQVPIDQTEVDSLIEKLKQIAPIIMGIVGALGLLKLGLMFGWEFGMIAGLILILGGLISIIYGVKDAWENGVDWKNAALMISGVIAVVLGLALAFGTTIAIIGAVVGGLALIAVGIHDIIENGVTLQNGLLIVAGVFIALVAAFGAGVALIGAAISACVLAIIADWDNFKQYVLNMWVQVKQAFANAYDAIFGRFKIFGQKMKEAWDKLLNGDIIGALETFGEGVESLLAGIINGLIFMVNGLFAMLSLVTAAICAGINAIINAINKIDVEIPDWVPVFGGKRFSPSIPTIPDFELPQIPYLATGTVVPANYGEFAAILGDNKKEPEVVSPLSTMKEAVLDAIREAGTGGGDVYITADADIAALIKLLNLHLSKEYKRIGRNMNKVVKISG